MGESTLMSLPAGVTSFPYLSYTFITLDGKTIECDHWSGDHRTQMRLPGAVNA